MSKHANNCALVLRQLHGDTSLLHHHPWHPRLSQKLGCSAAGANSRQPLTFLSSGVAPKQELPELGAGHMPELARAADPKLGQLLFANTCEACHNTDGSGLRRSIAGTDLGYLMPPLWGPDTFNDGAGMARLIALPNFIHFDMPHGTDYLDPQLSVENAWDIAAYVLSHPRPHLARLEHDFPDLFLKPMDARYGPYADHFSERQHKNGPFVPISAEIERLEQAGGAH